ncbi:MAG TPA: hypothetical protein VKB41_08305 [Steroidobacteraceae bacterium]|nr:hypothetical protein [Steroidobacteraceae bacterium]
MKTLLTGLLLTALLALSAAANASIGGFTWADGTYQNHNQALHAKMYTTDPGDYLNVDYGWTNYQVDEFGEFIFQSGDFIYYHSDFIGVKIVWQRNWSTCCPEGFVHIHATFNIQYLTGGLSQWTSDSTKYMFCGA